MTYKLRGSEMIPTALYMPLAIAGYQNKADRAYIRAIFRKGWGLSASATHALLTGRVPYTVGKDNAVEFELE